LNVGTNLFVLNDCVPSGQMVQSDCPRTALGKRSTAMMANKIIMMEEKENITILTALDGRDFALAAVFALCSGASSGASVLDRLDIFRVECYGRSSVLSPSLDRSLPFWRLLELCPRLNSTLRKDNFRKSRHWSRWRPTTTLTSRWKRTSPQ
jgi:hypothetical protein